MLRTRYQLLLIILVALTVFYPTLFSEFCRVDDLQMVSSLQSVQHFSLKDIFIPGGSGGLYYRPFIFLSYYLDRFVFGLDSFVMHLHNLLLHTVNALLLYWIAKKVGKKLDLTAPFVPLIVALLFLLHPITTESINWVSGRTDVLAGTFLLGATGLLLTYLDCKKRQLLYAAFFLFVCAVLTKEFSLAFLPGFIWLASFGHYRASSLQTKILFVFLAISAVALFFLLRAMAYTSNASQISTTVKVFFNTPEHSLQMALTAIGFYVKKLFIPMPLNFAIYEVNALYQFVALPMLALLAYIAWKRTLLSILFVTGILLASPALLIVFNQIAWTPFGERYLYLSAAFVTLSTVYYLEKNLEFPNNMSRYVLIMLVLSTFAGVTFQRNLTWQTAYSIVGDTVQKSPESPEMKFEFVVILIDRGEYARARSLLATSKSVPGIFYDERGDMAEAEILVREGRRGEAIKLVEYVAKSSGYKSTKALNGLLDFYLKEEKRSNYTTTQFYRRKTVDVRRKLFRVTKEPTILFELGRDALILGDRKKAAQYFKLASGNIPFKDPKNGYSKIMVQGLS